MKLIMHWVFVTFCTATAQTIDSQCTDC